MRVDRDLILRRFPSILTAVRMYVGLLNPSIPGLTLHMCMYRAAWLWGTMGGAGHVLPGRSLSTAQWISSPGRPAGCSLAAVYLTVKRPIYLSVPVFLHHCIHLYASIYMYAYNSVYMRQVPHCARAAVYANGGIFNASAVAILQSHQ